MHLATTIALVGVGATAMTDLWALLRWRVLAVPAPDYRLLGRWLGHMPRGHFRHHAIKAAPALRGEAVIGWLAHYLIGIAFAGVLAAICGPQWFAQPRLAPAIAVGIGTVLAPFLLMQPGMGAGIAARLTPRPAVARLHSLITHLAFGVGLYAAASAIAVCSAN